MDDLVVEVARLQRPLPHLDDLGPEKGEARHPVAAGEKILDNGKPAVRVGTQELAVKGDEFLGRRQEETT